MNNPDFKRLRRAVETLLSMYYKMVLIRHFEENINHLFLQGKMPGTIHLYLGQEAVNIGAIWDLPVVYVCENNLYGASTYISKVMKVEHVSDRASAYGILGETIDGNDVFAVYQSANEK